MSLTKAFSEIYWKTFHKIKKQIEEEEDMRSRKEVSNLGGRPEAAQEGVGR